MQRKTIQIKTKDLHVMYNNRRRQYRGNYTQKELCNRYSTI